MTTPSINVSSPNAAKHARLVHEITELTGRFSRGSWTLACFDIDTFKLFPFHDTRSRLDIAVSHNSNMLQILQMSKYNSKTISNANYNN